MSTYLIDFENVKSGGLAGIEHIRKGDSVHLFWSARENKITIEMMELIRSSESEIVMHKAVTGERDALDHQLCSYLGFLAGGRGETDFVIVSNDKAYDHLIEFWRKMNDRIHIQRVSEISRAVETVHVPETAAETAQMRTDVTETETVRMEKATADKADKADKAAAEQNNHAEAAERVMPDTYSSRNSRRRERGSRYLKGGRIGRSSWKNNYEETYVQERPAQEQTYAQKRSEEEKTVDRVKETGGYQTEKAVPAEPKKDSAAAYVVTGIRTGVLVESGFTADGILTKSEESPADTGRKNESEKPGKEAAEKVPEKPAEKVPEKPAEKAAEKVPEKPAEKISEKPAENTVEKTAEHAVEKTSAEESEKAAVKPAAESESTAVEPAVLPEKEADNVQSELTLEQISEKAAEAPENPADQPEESVSEPKKEETGEKQTVDNGKKPRSRASKTTARTKRGRPSKKEHTEIFPEIRIPIIESDVVAKCEEAANAEWTGEVVRLINYSKDKKELYSAIVKLLGQEKGRTVYHAIKVLK